MRIVGPCCLSCPSSPSKVPKESTLIFAAWNNTYQLTNPYIMQVESTQASFYQNSQPGPA